MKKRMISFLNEQAVRESREKARRATLLWGGLGAGMGVLLAVLCLLTRTGNVRTMLAAAWAGLILPGLGWIALWMFRTEPARAEARHLEGLAEGTPESREGILSFTGDSFRIPKSVRVRKIRLETAEDVLSLNLNERLWRRMPPDGSRVRVQTVRKFITGLEVLEAAPGEERTPPSRRGAAGQALARFFPAAVIWVILVLVFTGFLFNRITDTDPAHKLTVYADCEVRDAVRLAERMEKALDGAVRMVKVHPFSYALFGSEALKSADLYIVPDSRKGEYGEWFLPGEEGLPVHDPGSGTSVCGTYFDYTGEPYRLYTGARSPHLEDGLARKAAELLMTLEPEKEENP